MDLRRHLSACAHVPPEWWQVVAADAAYGPGWPSHGPTRGETLHTMSVALQRLRTEGLPRSRGPDFSLNLYKA